MRVASRRAARRRAAALLRQVSRGPETLPVSVQEALQAVADGREAKTDFDVLALLLDHEDETVAMAAAQGLERLAELLKAFSPVCPGCPYRSPSTAGRLRAALRSGRPEVVRHLLLVLARLPFMAAEEALPVVVVYLTSPIDDLRAAALVALRSLGVDLASAAVGEVAQLINDPYPHVRREAVLTLHWFGPDARPFVKKLAARLAAEGESAIRSAIAQALVELDPEGDELRHVPAGPVRERMIAELRLLGADGQQLRRSLLGLWGRVDPQRDDDIVALTRTDIARFLGVSERTVRRMIAAGDLPVQLDPENPRRKVRAKRRLLQDLRLAKLGERRMQQT